MRTGTQKRREKQDAREMVALEKKSVICPAAKKKRKQRRWFLHLASKINNRVKKM